MAERRCVRIKGEALFFHSQREYMEKCLPIYLDISANLVVFCALIKFKFLDQINKFFFLNRIACKR